MQVKHVITVKQTGTNGIPAVHSNCFIHISNNISGSITTTHTITNTIISATSRNTNLTLRPIIKSDAACKARIGYIPGALTATSAIKDDDSKYPDSNIINAAKTKNTNA